MKVVRVKTLTAIDAASPATTCQIAGQQPARARMRQSIQEAWHYRTLLWHLIIMDLKVRYRNSLLGFLWTLLNPILLMLVMWMVFGRFRPARTENYAMFLLAGLMTWTFFAGSVNAGLASMLRHRSLLKKLYLPKVIFPLATVGSQLVNYLFFLLAYLILTPFAGMRPHPVWLMLLPATAMVFLFSLGLAYVLAALNVYFRDITHITAAVMRAWFYLTPIFYSMDLFPRHIWLFLLNPMTYMVECIRQPLLEASMPSWEMWVVGYLWGLLLLVIGHGIFKRLEHDFIYYL